MNDSADLPVATLGDVSPPQDPFWQSQFAHLRAFVSANLWAVMSLVAFVCVLYAPALKFEFLNWDDPWYIVNNDLIKSWHPLNLYRVATEPVARNFAPLTIGMFLVEHTLWGLNSTGYHATNILLHALNAVLVFALIRQLTRNNWTAWIVAALFAVHPIQIESVAWVSSRKTLLSSTFMLLSGLCSLRPQRTGRDEAWSLLWLVLGLLSKASTVVVPPIVMAYDYLIRRQSLENSILKQIFPCVLCAMLTFITMSAQVTIVGGVRGHLELSKLEMIGVDATLMSRYLAMLAIPNSLCVLYDPPWKGIGRQIAQSFCAWASLTVVLWRNREQFPQLAFALATWLWLLFPVMNFFPITTLMNDRYMYLPCIVVFCTGVEALRIFSGWVMQRLSGTKLASGIGTAVTVGLGVVAIGAYATAATHYLPVWQNPITLWSYARQHTPSLVVVHRQWADALQRSGDTPGALAELQYTLDHCHPDEGEITLIKELQLEWSKHE